MKKVYTPECKKCKKYEETKDRKSICTWGKSKNKKVLIQPKGPKKHCKLQNRD